VEIWKNLSNYELNNKIKNKKDNNHYIKQLNLHWFMYNKMKWLLIIKFWI